MIQHILVYDTTYDWNDTTYLRTLVMIQCFVEILTTVDFLEMS